MAELEEGSKLLSKGGNTFDIIAQGWNAFKQ
jgi:thiamine-monophosphate kinase